MRRVLALLISAVPLLLRLGATVAFTNNDVSFGQRQSSARRLVSYSDYLSGMHSSPEETPTGKSTDHPSNEKLSTSAASTDYLSSLSSRTTTSSTSGSWAANGYASPLSSHQQKETAPKPVELKKAMGEASKPPVATTDFSYLKDWNTEGNAGSYLDRLNSTPTSHSEAGIPSTINALSSTDRSLLNSDSGVATSTDTQAGASLLPMRAGDVDPVARTDFSYLKDWNAEGKAGPDIDRVNSTPASHSGAGIPSHANDLSSTATSYPTSGPDVTSYTNTPASSYSSLPLGPTPSESEPPSAADLQSQFGLILENQLEITKQVGTSISELKEIQDQQGQYIQIMAKNDIEMTQMMVSVRDDSSEMRSDMRRAKTQQAGLEERLAALEAKLADQATRLQAPPEPTASIPTPAAAATPQTSVLDTSSSVPNTINAGRAVVQDINPPATKKPEASAQVASGVERMPSVPMALANRHKVHLALMISCGVYGAIIQTILHTDTAFRRS